MLDHSLISPDVASHVSRETMGHPELERLSRRNKIEAYPEDGYNASAYLALVNPYLLYVSLVTYE